MNFRIEFSISKLYNGCRSFFGVIQFGRNRYWLQRWDTARIRSTRGVIHAGSVMT